MFKKKEVLFLREEYGEGLGKYTYSDGSRYIGEFKNGKKDGRGTYTFPSGKKYVGEWKEGKRNGQGTSTSLLRGKYEGVWKDGKEWNGTLQNRKGNIIGKFVNGKKIKQ